MRGGEIEGGFPELDFQRVKEPEENARQGQHQQRGMPRDVMDVKAVGDHIHADRREEDHRLVGHYLDQLAFRADEAVWRAGLVPAQHQEDRRQRQRENDQQQVRPGEEQRAGENHQQQEEKDIEVLRAPHDDGLLPAQLEDIVKRLEDGRALPGLHARRDPPVPASEQAADDRRRDQVDNQSQPGIHIIGQLGRRRFCPTGPKVGFVCGPGPSSAWSSAP